MLVLNTLGFLTTLRGEFPKVPLAGRLKAAVLKNPVSGSPPPDSGSPTRSGRTLRNPPPRSVP